MASETNKRVFLKFLEFCKLVTDNDNEVLKLVNKRYDKASRTYLSSEEFLALMQKTTKQIKKDPSRKFVYIKEFITELKAYGAVHLKSERQREKGSSEPPAKRQKLDDPAIHGNKVVDIKESCSTSPYQKSVEHDRKLNSLSTENNHLVHVKQSLGCVNLSEDREQCNTSNAPQFLESLGLLPKVILKSCTSPLKCSSPVGQPVSHTQPTDKRKVTRDPEHTSPLLESATGDSDLDKAGSEKHIKRLEALLGELKNEIERLEEVELDLDDLEKEDSNYILIDRYKAKFVKVWNKLCEIKGRNPSTGRPIERRFRYEGTRYPVINRKVEKFINKHNIFPDYQDIHTIICYCNKKHSLRLRKKMLQEIAKDVFMEVGNRLQERRLEDFALSFGSHLTDRYKAHDDPAIYDRQLRKRLEENQTESKSRLDEVINKYAAQQYAEDKPSSDEEEDDDDGGGGGDGGAAELDNCLKDDASDIERNDDWEDDDEIEDERAKDDKRDVVNEDEMECQLLTPKKYAFSSIFVDQQTGRAPETVDENCPDKATAALWTSQRQPEESGMDKALAGSKRRCLTKLVIPHGKAKKQSITKDHSEQTLVPDGGDTTGKTGSQSASQSQCSLVINDIFSLHGQRKPTTDAEQSTDISKCQSGQLTYADQMSLEAHSNISQESRDGSSSSSKDFGSPCHEFVSARSDLSCNNCSSSKLSRCLCGGSQASCDADLTTTAEGKSAVVSSLDRVKKESASQLSDSSSEHLSDKENIISPLISGDTAAESNQDLPAKGSEQVTASQDEDCIDMGIKLPNDGKVSMTKKLRLSNKVRLDVSSEGLKKASKALRTSLNKLGHVITAGQTSTKEIEILSDSGSNDEAEEAQILMNSREIIPDAVRKSRSETTIGHSTSFTTAAEVHSEQSNDSSASPSCLPSKCKTTEDQKAHVSPAAESQSSSPAKNLAESQLVNNSADNASKDVPSEVLREENHSEERGTITMTTEYTQEENAGCTVDAGSTEAGTCQPEERHPDDDHCQSEVDRNDRVEVLDRTANNLSSSSSSSGNVSARCEEEAKEVLLVEVTDENAVTASPSNNFQTSEWVNTKECTDDGGSSDVVAVVDNGSDSDDCVMITQVDLKRKPIKTEQVKRMNPLPDELDLTSICSSAVSKVLQENRAHLQNRPNQPVMTARTGYQYVTPQVQLDRNKPPVGGFIMNPKPAVCLQQPTHSLFKPQLSSTPVKLQPVNSAQNVKNSSAQIHLLASTQTVTRVNGPTNQARSNNHFRMAIKNGNGKIFSQTYGRVIEIKPTTQETLPSVKEKQKQRRAIQKSDVIVLSDSD